MFDFILELISSALSGGTSFDVDSTRRQRVRHALRLSRKRRPLSPQQHEFAVAWLKFALANLTELKMNPQEVDIRVGLLRLNARTSAHTG